MHIEKIKKMTFEELYTYISQNYLIAVSDIVVNKKKSVWVDAVIALILSADNEKIKDISSKFQGLIGNVSNVIGYNVLDNYKLISKNIDIITKLENFKIRNKNQAIDSIKINPIFFFFFDDHIKIDLEVCYQALKINEGSFKYFHPIVTKHLNLDIKNAIPTLESLSLKPKNKSFFSFFSNEETYNAQEVISKEFQIYNTKLIEFNSFITKLEALSVPTVFDNIHNMLKKIAEHFHIYDSLEHLSLINLIKTEIVPYAENCSKQTQINNDSINILIKKTEHFFNKIQSIIDSDKLALDALINYKPENH